MDNQEEFGVEIWLCATIYTQAASEEAAREYVAATYAGTLENTFDLNLGADEKLSVGGDDDDGDILSAAFTCYGLADLAELAPVSPLASAAPDMLAALKSLVGRCKAHGFDWSEMSAAIATIAKAEGAGS